MPDAKPPADKPALDALVLYRNRPARVKNARGDRIEIEFDGGSRLVRPKDVTELHPGPLSAGGLAALVTGEAGSGDVDFDTARELLEDSGEEADLRTLCELLYGCFTPPAAWAAWRILSDGLWFEGTPRRIRARSAEAVAEGTRRRREAALERLAWGG
ncbi:MAG: RNB domain-containing ribonuclease, partial [Gemmatimonadetes bacterium]|nr:RNB domain-containing ribonuclease [Gemmatimonadota bacterium]